MTLKTPKPTFPFTAIVGQEELKLALLLNIIDPTIGGVLAIGDKGTGKTTLIRSLAHLMNQQNEFPFVNLPIGASEDRVLGHINLEKLINDKKEVIQKGLLAKAHQGILYVDEINLLNDYLMDVLLDASTTGHYHLEREGISTTLDSKFCMVGSMNPEEGQLRPQLRDRFGLNVNIHTPTDLHTRTQIVQNRLSFDDNPTDFCIQYEYTESILLDQITTAKRQLSHLTPSADLISYCSELATKHHVEGIRADILLIKTARAYTAYLNKEHTTTTHVDHIAHYVLDHRSNQKQPSPEQQNQPHNQEPENQESQNPKPQENNTHHTFETILPHHEIKTIPAWKQDSKKGLKINPSIEQKTTSINPNGNQNKPDLRQTLGQYQATNRFEFKHKKTQNKSARHLIILLDSSGSMAKDQAIAYSKGLIEKIVKTYEFDHLSFSLITLYDAEAHTIAQHTSNSQELINKLQEIKTGGKTNIIPALKRVKELTNHQPDAVNQLIIITDGKFNTPNQENEITVFQTYCKAIQNTTVIDVEAGIVKLNLAKTFAQKIKATYEPLMITNTTQNIPH